MLKLLPDQITKSANYNLLRAILAKQQGYACHDVHAGADLMGTAGIALCGKWPEQSDRFAMMCKNSIIKPRLKPSDLMVTSSCKHGWHHDAESCRQAWPFT